MLIACPCPSKAPRKYDPIGSKVFPARFMSESRSTVVPEYAFVLLFTLYLKMNEIVSTSVFTSSPIATFMNKASKKASKKERKTVEVYMLFMLC